MSKVLSLFLVLMLFAALIPAYDADTGKYAGTPVIGANPSLILIRQVLTNG